MTTVDQLPAATAAADTDLLPIDQGGVLRAISRALLLAGTQPELSLPAGSLLGNASGAAGGAAPIALGANLTLANNTLSAAAAPFEIAALPAALAPGAGDLVALGQGGVDKAIAYAGFMAGIGTLGGISASNMLATPTGATASRRLADSLADAVAVEAFGAVGDGVTDDTAALATALASGRPVRLAARTYAVQGQWTIPGTSAALLGVPGQSVIRRLGQTGNGAFIAVQCTRFFAAGVTFDANRAGVTTDSWGVLVTAECTGAVFENCVFTGVSGATQGCGLVIAAADPEITAHLVDGCEAFGNALHGIWVQAVQGVQILGCRAHDNGAYGICLDYADPAFIQKVHLCQISGNVAWANQRGISVGNFNATNQSPPLWGNANPDALAVLVSGNVCHGNAVYGIYAAGQGLAVRGNLLADNGGAGTGAGLTANVSASIVAGNLVTNSAVSALFGIDVGGSIGTDIVGNTIAGTVNGINPGGGQNLRVCGNRVQNCSGWAVLVNNVETDGQGRNFGLSCNGLAITDNWFSFATASGGGVMLRDAPQGVEVARNTFIGTGAATSAQCLAPYTDQLLLHGNSWNFQSRAICNPGGSGSGDQIIFPDVVDGFMITAAPQPVTSMLSTSQVATSGQVTFVKVDTGGSGYSQATVSIGGTGTGASASALVSNGAVIGVVVTAGGTGYGAPGTSVPVTIGGDGSGATATACAGLPVFEERRLAIRCNTAVTFARNGSAPFQDNWTLDDITVPANAEVVFTGTWGAWRAGLVPLADYLQFAGDGSLTLSSHAGTDVWVRPGAGGHLRIASQNEPAGVISTVGRGSPAGVLAAPPGSDYRNLDGGAGSTLWIKQSGTDATGWTAIA